MAVLVTVLDGHPATLSWLGAVAGRAAVPPRNPGAPPLKRLATALALVQAGLLAACAGGRRGDPTASGPPEAVSLLGAPLYARQLPPEHRQRLEADLAAAYAVYQRHYLALNGTHASVYPGVHEGLGRLHARQVSARGGELFCELRGDRVGPVPRRRGVRDLPVQKGLSMDMPEIESCTTPLA